MDSFGDRIRDARHSQRPRITQRDLADELGVTSITVSRWERGVTELSARRLRQIAKATGKPVDFFFEAVS